MKQGKHLSSSMPLSNQKYAILSSHPLIAAASINPRNDDPMLIPHFGIKRDIEKYLKSSAEKAGGLVNWMILRPTSFINNLTPGFVGSSVATTLRQTGRTRVSFVSVKDIEKVALIALERVDDFRGRVVTLTGGLLKFVSFLLSNSGIQPLGRRSIHFPNTKRSPRVSLVLLRCFELLKY